MDVVYILGDGSRWSDQELWYSLLSVQQYLQGVRQIFVVGDAPRFGHSKVPFCHKPAFDLYRDKQNNARGKLQKICDDPDISEDFLLMNDDFFLTTEVDIKSFPYYTQGVLAKQISYRAANKPGKYLASMQATEEWLKARGFPTQDFELHCPIRYNRTRLREVLAQLDWPQRGYLIRSLYANTGRVIGTPLKDLKIESAMSFAQLASIISGSPFFSLGDLALNSSMKRLLEWKFCGETRQ